MTIDIEQYIDSPFLLGLLIGALSEDDVKRLAPENNEKEAMSSVTFGQANSLAASIDALSDENMVRWSIPAMMVLNAETSDRREMLSVAGYREFPLPFMVQTKKASGHDGSELVGTVEFAEVDGDNVPAWGYIDASTELGKQTVRQIELGILKGVSVDIGSCKYEAVDGQWTGDHTGGKLQMSDLEIIGLTATPFPAFAQTRGLTIDPVSTEDTILAEDSQEDNVDTILASAPVEPPIEWFQNPGLTGRTRLTVTEDGRVFGHLAPWGECHIGLQGQCVRAPKSRTEYGWFSLGTMRCAEGCEIPVGTITMDTNHAGKSLRARAAAAHYDNTGTVVADIAVGEDAYGIYVAGAMRSTATPEQYRALRAARLSGDWRNINGNLELVAALAVNVGGFPVYEQSLAADGSIESLVASIAPGEFTTSAPADLPIASKDRVWDSAEAETRVREWAGGDNLDLNKYGQAFLWHAPDASTLADFKLPFADVIDGELTAVPAALNAIASVLGGGRGGVDIPESDVADVESRLHGYQERVGAEKTVSLSKAVSPYLKTLANKVHGPKVAALASRVHVTELGWDEESHPRDSNGRFGSGDGGSSTDQNNSRLESGGKSTIDKNGDKIAVGDTVNTRSGNTGEVADVFKDGRVEVQTKDGDSFIMDGKTVEKAEADKSTPEARVNEIAANETGLKGVESIGNVLGVSTESHGANHTLVDKEQDIELGTWNTASGGGTVVTDTTPREHEDFKSWAKDIAATAKSEGAGVYSSVG